MGADLVVICYWIADDVDAVDWSRGDAAIETSTIEDLGWYANDNTITELAGDNLDESSYTPVPIPTLPARLTRAGVLEYITPPTQVELDAIEEAKQQNAAMRAAWQEAVDAEILIACRKACREDLALLRRLWTQRGGERTAVWLELGNVHALVVGGTSWGDAPELFRELTRIPQRVIAATGLGRR